MPDFYYQIKGRGDPDGYADWGWRPVFTNMVTAPDKASAKAMIEEEYERQFPLRVLKKDIREDSYLLYITELNADLDYRRKRFVETECKECGSIFRIIDKYNDLHCDFRGPDYCSMKCKKEGQFTSIDGFKSVDESRLPPVIYQIRQISTGKVYIGQTIKPFTLRWWQHLTYPSDSKFHEAMKTTPITDWDFKVVEVIVVPQDCESKEAYVTDRERHWIDANNSVADGFNTIRPKALSRQQSVALESAEAEQEESDIRQAG